LRAKLPDVASGGSKATGQTPIGLLDAGSKIGGPFAPAGEALELAQLKGAVHSGMTGKLVDGTDDEDGDHVEICVEERGLSIKPATTMAADCSRRCSVVSGRTHGL